MPAPGFPDEKIVIGTNEEPPSETDMYCLVITTLDDSE